MPMIASPGFIGRRPAPVTPTIESRATSAETTDPTSHTVTMPAGVVSGDLIIVGFATDGNPSVTWPEGWTSFFNKSEGAQARLEVGWRKADGTEGASITVETDAGQDSAHSSYRISGAKDPTVDPPEASVGASAVNPTPDPANLAPSTGLLPYMWLVFQGSAGTKTTAAYPASYINGQTVTGNDSDGCGIGSAERALEASSENPGTFTLSGAENWAAATVAIIPA